MTGQTIHPIPSSVQVSVIAPSSVSGAVTAGVSVIVFFPVGFT